MTRKAVFYHAGCPICVDAEREFAEKLDPKQYEVEIVHLGQAKSRIAEAEAAGENPFQPSSSMVARTTSILGLILLPRS
jgi:hypothetical protein